MQGYYTGLVCDVDAKRGFVKVTYPGENDFVSDWLPLPANEYNMPDVGAFVATVLDKNGGGVCLGKIFSNAQTPDTESGYKKNIGNITVTKDKDEFKIDFGDGAFVEYRSKTLTLHAEHIVIDEVKT